MTDFRFPTAEEAQAAFYEALSRASLNDMMAVWAEDGPLVCIHPMGTRLLGRAAIGDSWRQIFGTGKRLRFEIGEVVTSAGAELSVHWVHEHIVLGNGQQSLVFATNVYRLGTNGWRMVAHHGSPGPAPQQATAPASPDPSRMH